MVALRRDSGMVALRRDSGMVALRRDSGIETRFERVSAGLWNVLLVRYGLGVPHECTGGRS
jgi:hypothetical protein